MHHRWRCAHPRRPRRMGDVMTADRLLPPLVKRQAPGWTNWRAEALTPKTYPLLNDRQLRQIVEMQFRVRLGVSSSALIRSGITGEDVPFDCRPHDWGDLERCEIAHAIAPLWLKERMTATLLDFRDEVYGRGLSWDAPADQFRSPVERLPVENSHAE